MEAIADFLYNMPLFDCVERPMLIELAKRLEYRKFPVNTMVVRQDDQPQHIFLIKSGRMKLLRKVEFRIALNRGEAGDTDFLMANPT